MSSTHYQAWVCHFQIHIFLPGTGDSKPSESAPKNNGASKQQAHPGMAAAAMAAASNVASQLLARPSVNQTEAVASNGTNSTSDDSNSSTNSNGNSSSSSSDMTQKGLVTGGADIPWRQVAGLLHGQGITDPLGLVRDALPFLGVSFAARVDWSATCNHMQLLIVV